MSSNIAYRKGREMIDAFPEEIQHGLLRHTLRTRRHHVMVSMNGQAVIWKRSALRDYLRSKYPDVKNKRQGQ